tara:strand:+ start:162 stop:365 length:204 start_codon:yes stop_codon:yes gene_type:complete
MFLTIDKLREDAADLYSNYCWWERRVENPRDDKDICSYDLETMRRAWELYEDAEYKVAEFLNEGGVA